MDRLSTTSIIWLIVWISFCACLFLAWFFSHKAKHKERLMMIEKGIDPLHPEKKEGKTISGWLKLGIVIFGLSIGLCIISILIEFHALGRAETTPLAILGVCGGAALVIANYLENRKN